MLNVFLVKLLTIGLQEALLFLHIAVYWIVEAECYFEALDRRNLAEWRGCCVFATGARAQTVNLDKRASVFHSSQPCLDIKRCEFDRIGLF